MNDLGLRANVDVTDQLCDRRRRPRAHLHACRRRRSTRAAERSTRRSPDYRPRRATYFPTNGHPFDEGGNLSRALAHWRRRSLGLRGSGNFGDEGDRVGGDSRRARLRDALRRRARARASGSGTTSSGPTATRRASTTSPALGYRFAPRSQAMLEWEHDMNRLVGQRFRVMLWLTAGGDEMTRSAHAVSRPRRGCSRRCLVDRAAGSSARPLAEPPARPATLARPRAAAGRPEGAANASCRRARPTPTPARATSSSRRSTSRSASTTRSTSSKDIGRTCKTCHAGAYTERVGQRHADRRPGTSATPATRPTTPDLAQGEGGRRRHGAVRLLPRRVQAGRRQPRRRAASSRAPTWSSTTRRTPPGTSAARSATARSRSSSSRRATSSRACAAASTATR